MYDTANMSDRDHQKDKYWIWFTQIPGIGIVTCNRLLNVFSSPTSIYNASQAELETIPGVSRRQAESIAGHKSLCEAERMVEACHKKGIAVLTRDHFILNKMQVLQESAPVLLYACGKNFELDNTVGIVGARRCTQDTKRLTFEVTHDFVIRNHVIISGMAKGVDAYAHTTCIKAGGYTIAVLGNGLDICYPNEHKALMDSIRHTGLLLSEYPPGCCPAPYRFPQRNRLISALSDRLVVLSAGERSGALITAKWANILNKEVWYMGASAVRYQVP